MNSEQKEDIAIFDPADYKADGQVLAKYVTKLINYNVCSIKLLNNRHNTLIIISTFHVPKL